jgi:hypothetical protein
VWYVTLDIGVAEYAEAIGGLTRGLKDLASNLVDDLTQRQELRYLHVLAEELQGKINNILQMLPREPRTRRRIFSIGGKALKFLFGAALGEELEPINGKMEKLRTRVGELGHDTTRHMRINREMDYRIKSNAKTLTQMIQLMKLQSRNMIREQITLDQRINATWSQITNSVRRASYTREIEMLLMKLYMDIRSLASSLDMATLHKLTASLLPSQKLLAILRDIYVQLDEGYTFTTALKLENMHLFYASAEISVLATRDTIHLVIQIPLGPKYGPTEYTSPSPYPHSNQIWESLLRYRQENKG